MQAGIASILPTFILSGVIWPRQSMPHLLHSLSEILPVTLSCDLAQSLLLKSITHLTFKPICLGLITPLLWAIVFSFIGRWQMIQRTKI